jgi:Ran GTPase-activating protein (RanGAP) involved in mRNA processing and transport
VAGAKALAEALAANTTLTSLTLSDNYIEVEGAKALAEALVQNKSLAELSIKGNELGDEGVDALATALLVGVFAFVIRRLVRIRWLRGCLCIANVLVAR